MNGLPHASVDRLAQRLSRSKWAGRAVAALLVFAATVLAAATPASAAAIAVTSIRADFDNDGILDTVTVINDGRSSQVRMWLSHLSRFRVLRIPDQVVSVVATDIDADGRVDVSASTRRRGVFVWMNQGRGHMRGVKQTSPTLTARHRVGGEGSGGLSSNLASSITDDDPAAGTLTAGQRVSHDGAQALGAPIRAPAPHSTAHLSSTPPRAPPSA